MKTSCVTEDPLTVARRLYAAYARGDRGEAESILAPDFSFSSPVDPSLDRAGYFERCWPGAGQGQKFDFVREVRSGNEVIVTYELTWPGRPRGRNTEILTIENGQVTRAEVYFG
jgi:hypothetical protein